MTKLKSIKDYPVKIETGCGSSSVLSVDDLQEQIEEARKGRAKVDSKYVGNADGLNHIFEYSYDYARFLENMSSIVKAFKNAG